MLCETCGNQIIDGEKFCRYCGTPVDQKKERQEIVAKITSVKGGIYCLCADDKLYQEEEDGELKMLDDKNPRDRLLINRIMDQFKPGKTDVVR